jgi:putative alpha-1,2-mannosidase
VSSFWEENDGKEEEEEHILTILAPGVADGKRIYVKSLKVDGEEISRPVLRHGQIVTARTIEFEMSPEPTDWGLQGVL